MGLRSDSDTTGGTVVTTVITIITIISVALLVGVVGLAVWLCVALGKSK